MFGPLATFQKNHKENREKKREQHEEEAHFDHGHRHVLQRKRSMADFQDGKRYSPAENASLMQGSQVLQSIRTTSQRFLFHPKRKGGAADDFGADDDIDTPRQAHVTPSIMMDKHQYFGLYRNYPLAASILEGTKKREAALQKVGEKQMNHVRGSDGWFISMFVWEVRAMDNIMGPLICICLNALFACILTDVSGIQMPEEELQHWDTMYSLVLKTSLAYLLVFRLNRCSIRYWEARTCWGNITHSTRNLVQTILMYGNYSSDASESQKMYRDAAIRWGTSFCVAAKHFIRSEHGYSDEEFAGFLSSDEVVKLRDSNHSALMAASMCRYYLQKLFATNSQTPTSIAFANTIRLQECDQFVSVLIEQVSGMEKIRSTPLSIAYVTHLRTFLFAYCLLLPYVWVSDWSWSTIPLIAITFFALAGIEGVAQEVEIPFRPDRPNHLAMDAYCLVIMDSVLGLVVDDANMRINNYDHLFSKEKEDDDDDNDENDKSSTTKIWTNNKRNNNSTQINKINNSQVQHLGIDNTPRCDSNSRSTNTIESVRTCSSSCDTGDFDDEGTGPLFFQGQTEL